MISIKIGAAQIETTARATQLAAMLLQLRRAIGTKARGYSRIRIAAISLVIRSARGDPGGCWFTHIDDAYRLNQLSNFRTAAKPDFLIDDRRRAVPRISNNAPHAEAMPCA